MTCPQDPPDLFSDGEWFDAVVCWLTAGGDPALQIVIPSLIYGTILIGLFIVGSSPLIPTVVSIILAGVIFVTFPASAMQIVVIGILLMISLAGLVLTWRFGH